MCGIAGIVSRSGAPVEARRVRAMTEILAHRGPDDAGFVFLGPGETATSEFVDRSFTHLHPTLPALDQAALGGVDATRPLVGFGHRRLGIIDPGPTGHQPMATADRQVWLTYNGEIYNYMNLRRGLGGETSFVSTSDTEVVAMYLAKSGAAIVPELDGMFAFGSYDRQANEFLLVRDRFGVKPLYWALTDDYLIFASETKALFASGLVIAELDAAGVVEYCTFQNVLRDETIWQGVNLLPAGHVLRFEPGAGGAPTTTEFHPGYAIVDQPSGGSPDELAQLFSEAVTRQLVSDVPVGSFLSGGMDSGSIVAVAGRTLDRLHTFTGGFDLTNVSGIEVGFDERRLAEQLSYLLQTEHYAVVLKSGDMPAAMEKLTWHMDDPRAGMCYPGWYTSKLAGKFVKVCMAGTGGDELFGGYPWRYRSGLATATRTAFGDALFASWHRLVPQDEFPRLFSGDLVGHLGAARASFDAVLDRAVADSPGQPGSPENSMEAVLRFEFKSFLNGLLVTEDHVSMAHSLETRVPFLDNALSHYAWNLPTRAKFDVDVLLQNSTGFLDSVGGKLQLRAAMANFLPNEYVQQRKQGFSPPDENWYRGESLDYVKSVLLDPVTLDRPWFDAEFVEGAIDQHVQGHRNNRLLIWSLISLEWIQRHFVDERSPTPT